MFIELTDHLRCPAPHREEYLVLLPEEMTGRHVVTGSLGCPVCGTVYQVVGGVARLGEAPFTAGASSIDAEAAVALLGIDGPGGYLGLIGAAARLAPGLATVLPNVHFAAIDPPAELPIGVEASVLVAARIPLKTASMRGVVVDSAYGADPEWIGEAARVVLPGNRIVVEGQLDAEAAQAVGLEILASAAGCWVAKSPTTTRHPRALRKDAEGR